MKSMEVSLSVGILSISLCLLSSSVSYLFLGFKGSYPSLYLYSALATPQENGGYIGLHKRHQYGSCYKLLRSPKTKTKPQRSHANAERNCFLHSNMVFPISALSKSHNNQYNHHPTLEYKDNDNNCSFNYNCKHVVESTKNMPINNLGENQENKVLPIKVKEESPTMTTTATQSKQKLKKFAPPVKEEMLEEMKEKGVDFSKSFFILDGTAMLYRAHYSTTLIPGYNKDSMERMLIIFGSEVVRLLGFFNPKYIAISFDDIPTIKLDESGEKESSFSDEDNNRSGRNRDVRSSFRHDLLPSYKGNRKDRPAHILEALPLAKKMSQALGIACLSCYGYEADDIMATFAKWSRKRNIQTILVCQDKDLYQTLVQDEVYLLHPRTYELTTYSDLIKKTKGITAKLFPDYMALVGDRSDNIPGIRGIGPLTARLLLKTLGPDDGLEQMYHRLENDQEKETAEEGGKENQSQSKERQGKENNNYKTLIDRGRKRNSSTIIETVPNLRGNKQLLHDKLLKARDEAFLYKSVITLVDNVPMDGEYFTLSSFQYRGPSTYAEETMEELGFFAPLRLLQETDIIFDYF